MLLKNFFIYFEEIENFFTELAASIDTKLSNVYVPVSFIPKYKFDSVIRSFDGCLIAFDIKTKKFKFQLADGSIKSGIVSDEVINKGPYELPKCYKACIRIDKYISKDNILEKYCLNGLECTSDC